MKIQELSIGKWTGFVEAIDRESERGVAVLAASYIENLLGLGLRKQSVSKAKSLATFSARIEACEALGFLPPDICGQLRVIKSIRNHFSHHPFDASFRDDDVLREVAKLRCASTFEPSSRTAKLIYISTCSIMIALVTSYLGLALEAISRSKMQSRGST